MRLAAFWGRCIGSGDTAIIKEDIRFFPGLRRHRIFAAEQRFRRSSVGRRLSVISDRGHLKRGYEDIGRDLRILGADIEENIFKKKRSYRQAVYRKYFPVQQAAIRQITGERNVI